jgi:Ca2+-binding RTX toxin-like protein
MAIVTAYDRLGVGLNMIDTDSSFVPVSDLIPSGAPSFSQYGFDTLLIFQWYNNYQINLGIFASQYSGDIYTLDSIYAFNSNFNPLIDAYGININFNINDDFSGGAIFENLYSTNDIITGNKYSDVIKAGAGNDILYGLAGNDFLYGELGNDSLIGGFGNDTIDGGAGYDYSVYDANKSSIVGASKDISGIVTLQTGFGTDTLINIEELSFLDGNLTIDNLITQYSPAVYQTNVGNVTANIYTGAVSFLQFEMLGSSNGDIVTGSASNDFINLLGGDDAANGGAGQDVLDGGTGSNFLTGGSGADTFFLDGRSGTNTWSTITDFANEDNVNIWGWQQGTSQLILSLDGQGAEGFKGATFHYDLNGNGLIDTSITFSDLVLASLPSPSVEVVAGFGYLLFA